MEVTIRATFTVRREVYGNGIWWVSLINGVVLDLDRRTRESALDALAIAFGVKPDQVRVYP